MAGRLPADLLSRSAEEGARLVAMTYLDEIAQAERRLADSEDAEALHDFRVGLRRLRSCIRAYRASLEGSVSKRTRRRLRDLTLATNADRDSEVKLAWLRRSAGKLGPGETEGLAWLIGRLEGRQFDGRDEITSRAGTRFVKAAAKLRPRLETVKIVVRTGGPARRSFAEVTGELIGSHVEQLRNKLQAVSSPEGMTEAHAARIAAKRLRYLLEPLARRVPRVKSLVGRLKQLQDVLGDVGDMQVVMQEIASSVNSLRKADPASGALPGHLALLQLAREHSQLSFTSVEAYWADGRAEEFLTRAAEVGRNLLGVPEPPSDALAVPPERRPRSPAISVVG
jgi:CHAD domain-containing protein